MNSSPEKNAPPLVTVYVTNHNYGRFLVQAVDSVLHQTLKDFELILIDDGSTDHSRKVIEGYKRDPRVRIIYQKHRGLNVTSNIALRVARGKYLMRLDADDFLDRNALLVLSNALEQDPGLGLVFPDYYLVDAGGHVQGLERRHAFDKDVSLLDQPAHGACTMIRRQCLLAVGGYDERFQCQDGYDLWIKFISRYRVGNINLPLFYYRQHEASLTRNEKRILQARAAIKHRFVKKARRQLRAVAVIPVRGPLLDPGCPALRPLGGRPVLDRLIAAACGARTVAQVVVTSSDPLVEKQVRRLARRRRKLLFVPRGEELARLNVPLARTALHVLKDRRIAARRPEAIVLLSAECPFMPSHAVDEAVNTLAIFGADMVVGVRPENRMLYQHRGRGLEPILNLDRFTRLERDALWRNIGSPVAVRASHLRRTGQTGGGVISHIVVDQRSALALGSEFDWEVAEYLARREVKRHDAHRS